MTPPVSNRLGARPSIKLPVKRADARRRIDLLGRLALLDEPFAQKDFTPTERADIAFLWRGYTLIVVSSRPMSYEVTDYGRDTLSKARIALAEWEAQQEQEAQNGNA